jgi:hypothetical protein
LPKTALESDHPELVNFLLHIHQLAENAIFSKWLDIYMLGLEKEENLSPRPPGAR